VFSKEEANTVDTDETAQIRATLRVQDERGLHCRVSALLAYRLRVEAPDAEVTLRTLEGREADPKKPLQTQRLGARHSGVVLVEAIGPDAPQALEVVRSIVEREPLSREEVVEAIPEDVGGEIGEIRHNQKRALWLKSPEGRAWMTFRERDKAEVEDWKSPGGWLYELMGLDEDDDRFPCD
jgi:phosphotransferase system HPr (HPr) family protein